MATVEFGDCDALFCNFKDNFDDEVDGAPVFNILDRASIPDKFVLKSGSAVRVPSQSYALLPPKWGELVGNAVEAGGVLGLISLQGPPLLTSNAPSVCKQLLTSSEVDHRVVALRWAGRHLLVAFDSEKTFTVLGNQLLRGRLDAGNAHQVAALEPAIFCSAPKVVVNVRASKGHDLIASLVGPIIPFSSKFMHMRITINTQEAVAPPGANDGIPHLGLILMFDGGNQNLALRTLAKLALSPWKPVVLRPEVLKALDPGSEFFQNKLGGPVVGVNTGCPQSGLRIVVFVASVESFDNMVQFYKALLAIEPVSRNVRQAANTSYSIFPLSAKTELMVAYLGGVMVTTASDLELFVKVKDLRQVNADEMEGGSCRLSDPDGNSVIAFTADIEG